MLSFIRTKIPASFLFATLEFLIEKRFYQMTHVPINDIYTFDRVNYLTFVPHLKQGDIQKVKKAALFLKEQLHHIDEHIAKQIYGIYCQPTHTSFWQRPQPEGFLNLDNQDSKKDRIALILHTNTVQQLSDKELYALMSVEIAKLDLQQPLTKLYRQQQVLEYSKVLLLTCIGLLIHEAIQYDFYQKESADFLPIIAISLILNSLYHHFKKILQHHQYQADEKSIRFSNDADSLIGALRKKNTTTWINLFEPSSQAQREDHLEELKLKLA